MTQYHELIRDILIAVDEAPVTSLMNQKTLGFLDIDKTLYLHTLVAMQHRGLISLAPEYADNTLKDALVNHLTPDGYALLDKLKEETFWKKAKDTILAKIPDLILGLLLQLAQTKISGCG